MLDIQKIVKGQVWWADLEESEDRIVKGKRPVIVLQRLGCKVICVPTTKSSERYLNVDFRVSLSTAFDSFAMLDNVLTVDENRLLDYKGTLSEDAFERLFKNYTRLLNGDIIIRGGVFYFKDSYTSLGEEADREYRRNDKGQLLSIPASAARKREDEVKTIIRKEEQDRQRFSSKNLTEKDKEYILTHDCKDVCAAYGMAAPTFYLLRKKFREERLHETSLTENERLIISKSDDELRSLGISPQVAKFYRRQAKTEAVTKNLAQ